MVFLFLDFVKTIYRKLVNQSVDSGTSVTTALPRVHTVTSAARV